MFYFTSIVNFCKDICKKCYKALKTWKKEVDALVKEIVLVVAISAISPYNDPDYQRIIQELLALGLTPTGNKSVDAATLATAKQKIKNKQETQQIISQQNSDKNQQELEDKKIGASLIGDINKILLGLQ